METCFDKYKMYQMLCEMGIPTAKCFVEKDAFKEALEKGEISFPVFAKPVKGSASININKVTTMSEIDVLFDLYDDLMIQEYMDGQEYGADVYIDMISGKCTCIFVKKRLRCGRERQISPYHLKMKHFFPCCKILWKNVAFVV